MATTLSELQETNQKLQADIDMEKQLEKQRVEFFTAASHELKTPITIIKGQFQGMLYQVGRYKDREIADVSNTISSDDENYEFNCIHLNERDRAEGLP